MAFSFANIFWKAVQVCDFTHTTTHDNHMKPGGNVAVFVWYLIVTKWNKE